MMYFIPYFCPSFPTDICMHKKQPLNLSYVLKQNSERSKEKKVLYKLRISISTFWKINITNLEVWAFYYHCKWPRCWSNIRFVMEYCKKSHNHRRWRSKSYIGSWLKMQKNFSRSKNCAMDAFSVRIQQTYTGHTQFSCIEGDDVTRLSWFESSSNRFYLRS